MRRLRIAFVAVAIGAGACATAGPPPARTPDGLLVSVERIAAAGGWPGYKVEVDLDGTVRYEGRECVRTLGRAMARVAPEKLALIRAAIARANFADLAARCCVCELDYPPMVTITVADRAPPRTVENVCGTTGRAGMVGALAKEIDTIVETVRWVGNDSLPPNCNR
jgi:hypothetical protein